MVKESSGERSRWLGSRHVARASIHGCTTIGSTEIASVEELSKDAVGSVSADLAPDLRGVQVGARCSQPRLSRPELLSNSS